MVLLTKCYFCNFHLWTHYPYCAACYFCNPQKDPNKMGMQDRTVCDVLVLKIKIVQYVMRPMIPAVQNIITGQKVSTNQNSHIVCSCYCVQGNNTVMVKASINWRGGWNKVLTHFLKMLRFVPSKYGIKYCWYHDLGVYYQHNQVRPANNKLKSDNLGLFFSNFNVFSNFIFH